MKRWGVVLLVLAVLIPNANAFELDTDLSSSTTR